MDGWVDYLHSSFLGEHILFASLRLDTFWEFFLGAVLTCIICLLERLLSFAISKRWRPPFVGRSRPAKALWRASLYGAATALRLTYMLISMTYQIGLILTIVVALSVGQFFFEYFDAVPTRSAIYDRLRNPPLNSESEDEAYTLPMRSRLAGSRPRIKSKPEAIVIHPGDSNLARADAAAQELGIAGETELVKLNCYAGDQEVWEHGKGRDMARQLLGGRAQHRQSPQDDHPLNIPDDD